MKTRPIGVEPCIFCDRMNELTGNKIPIVLIDISRSLSADARHDVNTRLSPGRATRATASTDLGKNCHRAGRSMLRNGTAVARGHSAKSQAWWWEPIDHAQ